MIQFNLSKDHLVPTGTKKSIKSDQYGNYVMRCVANLDFYHPSSTIQDFLTWVDKYHPKNLGIGSQIVGSNTDKEDRFVSVFFAMQEDNVDWYINNRDCKYIQSVKKKASLPIACSDKQLQRFLVGSKMLLLSS